MFQIRRAPSPEARLGPEQTGGRSAAGARARRIDRRESWRARGPPCHIGGAMGIEVWTQGQPAVLVANPTAHSGKAADWIRHARALLDEARVPHRFVATEPEGATIERVRDVIDGDGARVIIYMGGVGTFAEV